MSPDGPIREGQILTGPLFNEPMQVETVRSIGPGTWLAGLVGQQSERFRRVTLTAGDVSNLTIADSTLSYDGDGRLLRLGLQAYSLGIAYEFDPYFGLSISRVDPLPHQLEAVYEHLLKLPSVRFLLADEAGAGKTIMAGLLVRELKLRGLIERVLVVCPANLTFQWQRELKEKFDEKFIVFKGSDIRDQFGVNQWLEQKQIVTSLDLAKRTEILPSLMQVHWDLVMELAALGAAMVGDRGELFEQRGQGEGFGTHRLRALRLPGGARLRRAQPASGPSSQRIDVHPLEAAVGLGVAAVAARKATGAPHLPRR